MSEKSKREVPETDTCIICKKYIGSNEDRAKYSILNNNYDAVGEVLVHNQLDCLKKGVVLLAEQLREPYQSRVSVSTRIGKDEFFYYCRPASAVIFHTCIYGEPIRIPFDFTCTFLNSYKSYNKLIFVWTDEVPKEKYVVPLLLSRDDPHIPAGILSSDEYTKTLEDAHARFDRGMCVRGKDEVQRCIILARYVLDTMITI